MSSIFAPKLENDEIVLASGSTQNVSRFRRAIGIVLFLGLYLLIAFLFYARLRLRAFPSIASAIVTAVLFAFPVLMLASVSLLVRGAKHWVVTNKRVHLDNGEPIELSRIKKIRFGRQLTLDSGRNISLVGADDPEALRAALLKVQK